ncbi:unnamed protein product [Closterium sp. Naga37s-1]|nr:unnamed protein product [Closterium sp. Naga37s-1]
MGRFPALLGLATVVLVVVSLSTFSTECVAQDSRSITGIDGSKELADFASDGSRRISSGQRWLLAAADDEEEAEGGDDEATGARDKDSDDKAESAASEEEEESEEEAPVKKKSGVKKALIKTKLKKEVEEEEAEEEPEKPTARKSSLMKSKRKSADADEEEEAEKEVKVETGADGGSKETDAEEEEDSAEEVTPKKSKASKVTTTTTTGLSKKKRGAEEEEEEKEGGNEGGEEEETTSVKTKKSVKKPSASAAAAAADEEEEDGAAVGGKKAGGDETEAADADADADDAETDGGAGGGAKAKRSSKVVKPKGKAAKVEEEESTADEGGEEEAAEDAAGGKAKGGVGKESESEEGSSDGGEEEEEEARVVKKTPKTEEKVVEEEEEGTAAAAAGGEGEGEGDGEEAVEEKGEAGGDGQGRGGGAKGSVGKKAVAEEEEEGSGGKSAGGEVEGEGEAADKAADDSGIAAAGAGAAAGAAAVTDQDEQKEQQEQQQEEQEEKQQEQKAGGTKEDSSKTPTAEEQEDKQEPAPEQEAEADAESFPPCDAALTDYTPCEDVKRSLAFPRKMYEYRERHCPPPSNALSCLVSPPVGYRSPPKWPESRDWAWYANVPYKHLTEEKAGQNWVRYEQQQQKFVFPGGGTMFPKGADAYVKGLGKLIADFGNGSVRTVVDTGCGVASFGAALLSHNMVAMSFAPRDTHEAQVQFALERGVPAMLGIMATKRQPYPARAFDLAHCSRCLIPWSIEGGLYLIEVDRLLRPGGYWVLSGPPVDWQHHNKHWGKPESEMRAQEDGIIAVATALCWRKVGQKDAVAVWQKRADDSCFAGKKGEARRRRLGELVGEGAARRVLAGAGGGGGVDGAVADLRLELCPESDNPDDAWYTPMKRCVSRAPLSSTPLAPWPKRLAQAPPRIKRASASADAAAASDGAAANSKPLVKRFLNSLRRWTKRVAWYKEAVLPALGQGRYRNIMDMNAGIGSFAAALAGDPVWVMNVVPVETPAEVGEQARKAGKGEDGVGAAGLPGYQWRVSAKTEALGLPPGEALGVIYERGLIGTYQDWCEPFSTYPRTYDLIHAAWLFSALSKRCDVGMVLREMDRVLRPEGAVIFRDSHAILKQIQPLAKRLRWDARFEANRPGGSGRILVCVKKYWVEG